MSLDETSIANYTSFGDGEFIATTPSRHRVRFSQTVICHILTLVEALAVGIVSGIAISYPNSVQNTNLPLVFVTGTAVVIVVLCAASMGDAATFDRFASRLALFPGALAAGAVTAAAAFLGGAGWLYILICAAIMFATIYIAKVPTVLVKLWLQASGRLSRYVAVVGEDVSRRADLIAKLRNRPDVEIVYSGSSDALEIFGRLVSESLLDEVVLTGPCNTHMIENISGLDVTLAQLVDTPSAAFLARSGGMARWGTPVAILSTPPLRDWRAVAKRVIDVVGSLVALTLLSPILIFCSLAVKLDSPGPVLFVQERQGYRNKPFRMLKFRTMHADMTDHRGSQLTLRNDPRVTRVGRFLRCNSIDELPQLFNVLIGDMSLVGPRPHPKGVKAGGTAYDELIPNFYARYRMKPGLTGLAQISGFRGNTETEQHLLDRFERDQRYVMEWSPFLDIIIMARTVLHLLKGTNAF